MKVLVCGGRYFNNRILMADILRKIHVKHKITHIICGAQRYTNDLGEYIGADWHAIEWALVNMVNFSGLPAKWTQGRSAGPTRNSEMLAEHPDIDLVVAFEGGRGTADMVAKARAKFIPVKEVG